MGKRYHSYIAMSLNLSQFFHSPRGMKGDFWIALRPWRAWREKILDF